MSTNDPLFQKVEKEHGWDVAYSFVNILVQKFPDWPKLTPETCDILLAIFLAGMEVVNERWQHEAWERSER